MGDRPWINWNAERPQPRGRRQRTAAETRKPATPTHPQGVSTGVRTHRSARGLQANDPARRYARRNTSACTRNETRHSKRPPGTRSVAQVDPPLQRPDHRDDCCQEHRVRKRDFRSGIAPRVSERRHQGRSMKHTAANRTPRSTRLARKYTRDDGRTKNVYAAGNYALARKRPRAFEANLWKWRRSRAGYNTLENLTTKHPLTER